MMIEIESLVRKRRRAAAGMEDTALGGARASPMEKSSRSRIRSKWERGWDQSRGARRPALDRVDVSGRACGARSACYIDMGFRHSVHARARIRRGS